MGRRFAGHAHAARAKMRAVSAALAILMVASPVAAAPKKPAARAEFERGMAAYKKKQFAEAREAFLKAEAIEPDLQTKFALMQSERQLGNCDVAHKLANELFATGSMPPEAVEELKKKLEECKPAAASKEPPGKEPGAALKPELTPPDKSGSASASDQPPQRIDEPVAAPQRSPWWKDPLGDALVGGGIIALGVGAGFLWSAKSAIDKRDDAQRRNLADFEKYQDQADSRGKIGLAVGIGGLALVGGGIIRYMTRGGGSREERAAMTGWMGPDGGGIAASGRF